MGAVTLERWDLPKVAEILFGNGPALRVLAVVSLLERQLRVVEPGQASGRVRSRRRRGLWGRRSRAPGSRRFVRTNRRRRLTDSPQGVPRPDRGASSAHRRGLSSRTLADRRWPRACGSRGSGARTASDLPRHGAQGYCDPTRTQGGCVCNAHACGSVRHCSSRGASGRGPDRRHECLRSGPR